MDVSWYQSEMRNIRGLTLIKLMKNEPNGHTRVIIGCEPMNSKIIYSNERHPLTPHDFTILVASNVYTIAFFFVRKLQ